MLNDGRTDVRDAIRGYCKHKKTGATTAFLTKRFIPTGVGRFCEQTRA